MPHRDVPEPLDGPVPGAVDDAQGTDLRSRGGALLPPRCDGRSAAAEAELAVGLLRGRATSVEATADPAEADRPLTARRLARPGAAGPGADRGHRGAQDPTGRCSRGDHGHRRAPRDGIPDAARQAAGDIFTTALRLGGSLTGEHGVGTLKRRWLADELGPQRHALQQRIKAAFDPHHILNPGKALWRRSRMATVLSVSGSPSPTSRTARLLRDLDARLTAQEHEVIPLDVRTLPPRPCRTPASVTRRSGTVTAPLCR